MEKEKDTRALKGLMIVFLVIVYVINGLSLTNILGGFTTGEISDLYINLFTPAGITFSIWSVIYAYLLIFALYVLGVFRKSSNAIIEKIGKPFILSCICNIAWMFSWQYQLIWLSLIFMIVLFLSLATIVMRLKASPLSTKEMWLVKVPFSIYFGWITVATVANITVFLVSIGWNGFGFNDPFWMIIIASVAALIGIITTLVNKDFFYGLVFVWAYAGILFKHLSPWGFAGMFQGVIITVSIAIAL